MPRLVEKVWGGTRLRAHGGVTARSGPIGESWEAVDLDGMASIVAEGPLAGESLAALAEAHGSNFLGSRADERALPFLIKLIDAQDRLSVQVHPPPAAARAIDGARSKEECWLVLDTDDEGHVFHGFAPGVDADSFRAALDAGEPELALRKVPVKAGDFLHVRPGCVHAIGAGVFLLEIQQPSDTTFRVWDWGRTGLDGNPRALHLDEAFASFDFSPPPPAPNAVVDRELARGISHALLLETGAFRVERLALARGAELTMPATERTLRSYTVTDGDVTLSSDVTGEPVTAETLDTVLAPASTGRVTLAAAKDAVVVLAGLPGTPLATP